MTTEKKLKKDKEIALELEYQIKEVKHQLTEQLKCLDGRLENHFAMTAELAEFYQRRAEVEMEYSKNLEKIVKQILTKHKAERQKRESWQNYSTFKLWQTLLEVTSKQSRCHAIFSESLNNIVTTKFAQMREDMNYIYRKCYGIATGLHAEIHKSMSELHSFLKTYHQYHGESMLLQSKLIRAETQKSKVEQDNKKGTLNKKLVNFGKKTEKHRQKVQEGNLKALKSRNEYLLSVDSTNAALRKYFIDDLPDLINAMDYSYHISLGQVIVTSVDLEATVNKLNTENLTVISAKAKDLNQISDRQVFLQLHHQMFSLPKRFDFLPHRGDTVSEVQAPSQLRDEMVSRVQTIMDRLHALKLENDELWKTLETTDSSMVAKLTAPIVDAVSIFQAERTLPRVNAADLEKLSKERAETQNFYFNKFQNYELNSNLAARLQAKCFTLEKVLAISKTGLHRSVTMSNRQLRRRTLGKFALEGRPKLFGGSIREYVNATGQEIPLVIRSCTKIINLYGMHHQGVFRIPGLQHEINEYKSMFERGEEPILVKVETRDINSVAGVLKLYFRELSEPLFPLQLFDELVACTKYNTEEPDELKKCLERLQELLLPLPRTILVVIRYLFAFLNHLSEYSDENMMDAHNLSVCFGPTLIPVPPDHDPVNHQNQINELVRILIVYQERIFPNDGGVVYEKFIIDEENDLEESVDNLLEGAGGENSEDDAECYLEAVALHDFQGRTEQHEVTMRKGDTLKLFKKISSDWWEGATNEQVGLIPHKLIAVSNRRRIIGSMDGEDKLFVSTESLPSRSVSVTAAVHSGSASNVDNFDRSISQPNICESPRRCRDSKTSKDKTDSVLSSASTITFSESSFSNLSDENRASLDNPFSGQRKDSSGSNKEDAKESKRIAVRDASTKGCDCRRSGTLDRKVESFSPLIPVLEIIEPAEVVLEAKNIPPCCSATVTPTENTETVTVVVATTSSSNNKNVSPCCVNNSALSSNKTTSATPPFKWTMEDFDSKVARLPSDAKSSNASLEAPFKSLTISESPEKSPSRFGGSLTDSYFSFSLMPLESKPPLPNASTSRTSSTSPSRVKQGSQGDASSSPGGVFVETLDTANTDDTLVTAFGVESVSKVSLRETDIIEASASSESPPAITPLHVCEATVLMDSSPSRSDDALHLSESFPPPPDELLVGFRRSVENFPSPEDQQPHSHPGSGEVNTSGAAEVGLELPPLSTPSILAYMQNRQKQGDLYHVPGSSQRFIQEHSPTQQQLNTQYAAVSESIALASLNGATHKTFNTPPPPSARSNWDLVGTKSLDAFNESEDTSSKKLSQAKIPSAPQVPGSLPSTASTSPLRTPAVRPQGLATQASPRLSALSMNLPTLSIYTTLAPNIASTSLPSSTAQVSTTAAASTASSPTYQSPSAPSSSCSPKPLFTNLSDRPAFKPPKDGPGVLSSPVPNPPAEGASSPSIATSDKNRSKPPPVLKKPGTKI